MRFITLSVATDQVQEDDLEQEVTVTHPVAINVEQIRSFHPRTRGRVGTRIVYLNGAAQPVTETFEIVCASIAEAISGVSPPPLERISGL